MTTRRFLIGFFTVGAIVSVIMASRMTPGEPATAGRWLIAAIFAGLAIVVVVRRNLFK